MDTGISFIIPYKYRKDRVGRLNRVLHHLYDIIDRPDDEIIISDQSLGIPMDELNDGPYTVYIHEFNKVFNRARSINMGLAVSENRFICTTDIDIVYPQDFISKVRPLIEENILLTFNIEEDGLIIHKGIPGFSIIFDKNKCQEIGMWDESFIGYGDEDNIFRDHYLLDGGKLKHVPLSIEHLRHPQSELVLKYANKAHQQYLQRKHELEEQYGIQYDPWEFNPK